MYFCDCNSLYPKPSIVTFDFLNVFFSEGEEMQMYVMPLKKLEKGSYFYIQIPSITTHSLIFVVFFS